MAPDHIRQQEKETVCVKTRNNLWWRWYQPRGHGHRLYMMWHSRAMKQLDDVRVRFISAAGKFNFESEMWRRVFFLRL